MKNIRNTISFVFQFLLLVFAYFVCCFSSPEIKSFKELLNPGLVFLIISWILTAWLTHKYKPQYYQRKWIYVIAPFIKAVFFHLFFILLFSSVFLGIYFRNGLLFKSSVLYLIMEFLFYSIIILQYEAKKQIVQESDIHTKKYIQHDLKLDLNIKPFFDFSGISAIVTLFPEKIIAELYPQVPETNPKTEVKVFTSVKDIPGENKQYQVCFLDIRINDLCDINMSFKSIYKSMFPGSYLFAKYEDLDEFEQEYLLSKTGFGRFFKTGYYYLYYRMLPKIPYLNYLYKLTSGGRNRVISRAETLGRLFYSGFDVEKEIKNDGESYLLARKVKTPSENPTPSFYPLIMLNRVGLYGTLIKIHKIRSMYPYSEFIQKKVYEDAQLTSTGKFENDFRITKIGKLLRKYWVDEIPQLLDWLRGKIKLVGIRAMSQHYFGLYPKEYQELYYKVKPGIISPIFDEKTIGFAEIVRIEQKYLESYLINPIRTDIKYFFITLKHVLKGVRSK